MQRYCQGAPAEEKAAVKLFFQSVSALSYLHDAQKMIIHRDIKPSNLMLLREELQIADFGHAVRPLTTPLTTPVGTIPFWSPEMVASSYSFATDMWSLGMSLLMVLTGGKHPFVNQSHGQGQNDITHLITTRSSDMNKVIEETLPETTSDECRQFLRKVFSPAEMRLTPAQAEHESWFKSPQCEDYDLAAQISVKVIEKLKDPLCLQLIEQLKDENARLLKVKRKPRGKPFQKKDARQNPGGTRKDLKGKSLNANDAQLDPDAQPSKKNKQTRKDHLKQAQQAGMVVNSRLAQHALSAVKVQPSPWTR